jgi:hypothetical protein
VGCTIACDADYFYHITGARGSGEYVLRHILAPGAWAYAPLQQRLMELKVGGLLAGVCGVCVCVWGGGGGAGKGH